jgi:hypothetical protein
MQTGLHFPRAMRVGRVFAIEKVTRTFAAMRCRLRVAAHKTMPTQP